jgi:hypothetical protein
MGINLCSVEGIEWTKQSDGQLVDLTIKFIPEIHDNIPHDIAEIKLEDVSDIWPLR